LKTVIRARWKKPLELETRIMDKKKYQTLTIEKTLFCWSYDKMYVRSFFPKLTTDIFKDLSIGEEVVLRGMSGIGKSYYLTYVFLFCVSTGRPVFLELSNGRPGYLVNSLADNKPVVIMVRNA
jgi:hypothetical protein